MCLLALAWHAHAQLPLAVVANRDEYYDRPSQAAHWWPEQPHILAGRDLQAGGTWMGITHNGRFAALTNYRNPHMLKPNLRSRGELVSGFLQADSSPFDYARLVIQQADVFNGFNLLLADRSSLVYTNNVDARIETLQPGVYGLSNALLDDNWPKTESAAHKLRRWLDTSADIEELARLLSDRSAADDDHLPDTGLTFELEKALSAEFIEMESYGTRCSTALVVDNQGTAGWLEVNFKPHHSNVRQTITGFWS